MIKSEINRRSLLKRSAGVMALAIGGGTPFLSSRMAFAQAADLAERGAGGIQRFQLVLAEVAQTHLLPHDDAAAFALGPSDQKLK